VEQLSVSVLGAVRATRAGTSRPIGSRRQRALLAALAVRHPRAVAVDVLIDAVWGEVPPGRARTTLQTYVSRLRASLGEQAIVHDGAGYRLGSGATVDAHEVRRELTEAQAALHGAPARASALAQAALDRWDGDALAGLADDEWFRPHAVGFDDLRGALADTLAEALVLEARWVEAADLLEAIVRDQPFRERAQLLLVRTLVEAGRPAEGLRAADRYRRALREETGLDPSPELGALEASILSGGGLGRSVAGAVAPTPVLPVAGPRTPVRQHRLPRPSALIGRDAVLADLRALTERHRLVTVLGTGGVGKTRLVAELLAGRREDEATIVVELAACDPDTVLETAAAAAGLRAATVEVAGLVDALGDEPTLLVLDSCEHVAPALGPVLRTVLDACPAVSVLTTSRTRLSLSGEQLVALQPLATSGEDPAAVALFADCLARSGGRGVDVDGPEVLELCRRLDGLPLALELAAGRAGMLGISALTSRLADSADPLAAPSSGREHRHTSLHALVAWSHDLLGAPARRMLAVLSVFEGEMDLPAVEAVCRPVLEEPTAPLLDELVDTCLVAPGSSPGRLRLLDVIRRFAADRLAGTPDEPLARRAHARWVAARIEAETAERCGPAEARLGDALDDLRADVRAALTWAASVHDAVSLAELAEAVGGPLLYRPDAEALGLLLDVATRVGAAATGQEGAALAAAGARAACLTGALGTARDLALRAVAQAPTGPAGASSRSRARHALGMRALYEGRFADAEDAFVAAAGEPVGDSARCDATGGAALAACYSREPARAGAHAATHRALAEATRSPTALAFADYIDGERHLAAGDEARAVEALRAAAESAWAVQAALVWGLASTVLAATLVRAGEHEDAARQLPVLLRRWRRTATWPQLWTSLRLVAEVLAAVGDDEAAALLLRAADSDAGAPDLVGEDLARVERVRQEIEARVGPGRLALVDARALVLRRYQVLDLAVEALGARPSR
jgi:predicted ATPase/DNA-binding SARP family transcriptional activator